VLWHVIHRLGDESRLDSHCEQDICLLRSVQIGSWVQSASYPTVPGVRRPGHEANHSPPSDTKVENSWRHTSTLRHHRFVLN
jgi:hypothetical protein